MSGMQTRPVLASGAAAAAATGGAGAQQSLHVVWGGEALEGAEGRWRELFASAHGNNPFLSWEWQATWWRTQEQQRGWRPATLPYLILERFADRRWAGLLALQWRTGMPGRWEMLGQENGGDELDLLVHPQADAGTAARLLREWRRQWRLRPAFCHFLARLRGVRAGGALDTGLGEMAGRGGLQLRRRSCDSLPLLRLPASFEEYLAQRSSNFRGETRRRRRALWRAFPQAEFRVIEPGVDMASALESLFELHNLRRRQKGGRGLFEEARQRLFHLQLCESSRSPVLPRVYLLENEGQALAALYGFQVGGRFAFYQSGMDPAVAEHSPGGVLMGLIVEDCIRRGLTEFDYLRGEEAYKSRWTGEVRSTVDWQLTRGWAGTLYRGAQQTRRLATRWKPSWAGHSGANHTPAPGLEQGSKQTSADGPLTRREEEAT